MMLEYQGYRAEIEPDYDANILFGRVLDIKTVITFQAERVDGIRAAFAEAVDDYLLYCKERGKLPERPFAGRISFRTTSENHRLIADAALCEKLSVNAWMERALVGAAHTALHRLEGRKVVSFDYPLHGPASTSAPPRTPNTWPLDQYPVNTGTAL